MGSWHTSIGICAESGKRTDLCPHPVGGVRFFLRGDKDREELEDDSSDEETVDLKHVKHQSSINKKTKKRAKAYEKALGKVKRQEKRKSAPQITGNFSAVSGP